MENTWMVLKMAALLRNWILYTSHLLLAHIPISALYYTPLVESIDSVIGFQSGVYDRGGDSYLIDGFSNEILFFQYHCVNKLESKVDQIIIIESIHWHIMEFCTVALRRHAHILCIKLDCVMGEGSHSIIMLLGAMTKHFLITF